MAYAALASLKYTIDRLINSSRVSTNPKIEHITKQIQEFLHELLSSQYLKRWDESIKKAACELEDSLESYVSDQFLISQPKIDLQGLEEASIDFEAAIGKIRDECTVKNMQFHHLILVQQGHNFQDPSIVTVLNKMVKEQNDHDNDDEASVIPSRTNHYVVDNKLKMVGVVGLFNKIRYVMLEPYSPLLVIPHFGRCE